MNATENLASSTAPVTETPAPAPVSPPSPPSPPPPDVETPPIPVEMPADRPIEPLVLEETTAGIAEPAPPRRCRKPAPKPKAWPTWCFWSMSAAAWRPASMRCAATSRPSSIPSAGAMPLMRRRPPLPSNSSASCRRSAGNQTAGTAAGGGRRRNAQRPGPRR